MFKKALVAAALLSAVSINAANAADGQIVFTGSIIAQTCEVNGSTPGIIPVALGDYTTGEFNGSGSTVGNNKITMNLTSCPAAVQNVQILFDGNADGTNADLLAVDRPGAGVGIGIYEADGSTAIPIKSSSANIALSNGNGNASFIAKYVATASAVTVGTANATADYTILYK